MFWELGLDAVREPHFPVRVPEADGRRPDLLLKDWEEGRERSILGRRRVSLVRFLEWKCLLQVGL